MPRKCGECSLCCTLLPVQHASVNKKANEVCKYQGKPGCCNVYNKPRLMPPECALWNCRWLVKNDTKDLPRPDRCHYVIDIMPDFIEASDNVTGEKFVIEVVQVWVDPNYPDAHRDPALRDYLARRAKENKAALIRYNDRDAFTLIAPSLAGDGEWHEVHGPSINRQHSFQEIITELGNR